MTFEAINRFRANLHAGKVCLGPGIMFADPMVTDALGSSSDFIWIDMEHGSMSPEAMSAHIMAAHVHGLPGIVRLPGGGATLVKPTLDSGADGIILPQIYGVDEVKRLVDDCRYPPVGHRGFGPRVPSDFFRNATPEFVAAANKSIFVSVMIETAEAYAAIDEIVAVPGLDSIVIGPADLSWSLGAKGDTNDPRVITAFEKIIKHAKKAGCLVGCGMGPDAVFAHQMVERGAQWIQLGADCAILIQGFDQVRAAYDRLQKKK
jgi:4-hydroxy-2-oxoheptanedioate aldolase